jgi:hypothetical protein
MTGNLNLTLNNAIANGSCSCSGCVLTSTDCYIPFTFKSSNGSTVQYDHINFDYNVSSFITNCSSGVPAINFTFRDEDDLGIRHGWATAYFSATGGSTSQNITLTYSDVTNFSVCIYPPGFSSVITTTIYYYGTDYPQRTYYEASLPISNVTQFKNLYLLNVSSGGYITFYVLSTYDAPIEGVQIQAVRVINGTNQVVEQTWSDGAGVAQMFVNPNYVYTFTFTKTNYQTYIATVKPSSGDVRTVRMASVSTLPTTLSGLYYDFNPMITLNNDTIYSLSFNMTSKTYDILDCNLYVYNSTSVVSIASKLGTFNTTNCNGTILFNTAHNYSNINFVSIIDLDLNGTTIPYQLTYPYTIRESYVGNTSLSVLLTNLNNFHGAGFDFFAKMIVALVCIVAMFGALAIGTADENTAIGVAILATFAFSYIGWLTVPFVFPTILGINTGKYAIFIIVALTGGGFLIRGNLR